MNVSQSPEKKYNYFFISDKNVKLFISLIQLASIHKIVKHFLFDRAELEGEGNHISGANSFIVK